MTTHTSTAQRSSKYPTTIGIDVGGTGMKGGLVRLGSGPKAGTLRGDRFRIPTPQPAMPEPVAATLAAITAELDGREKAPKPSAPLGVCFPSIVKDGVCLSANNIDHTWIGTDLRGSFEEHLRRPVTVVNDADAAGLAEARYGAGRGVRGLVHVITLGTGIGGAMVHDGVLVPNFEVGSLELDGVMAESRASAKARERDQLSWAEYAERLQRFFSHVERIFSPDLFIVGGGISKRPDDYLPLLRLRTPIVPAQLQNNAGIVGAALAAHGSLADGN
ncbi:MULTISPECIES: polyphosphate--glucose phosphotransferase [Micrococcus]|uniref:polyphosphate--glucose phosphotransferase n=1 Tax=Micrococcus TaxID=1269 RepID=UPI0011A83B41|nr:ROK family protein [Micrococcus luteus]MCC0765309.1 ROK family protein [Micrococcus luteus]MCK6109033.1 ROK family protein [Micrococcus luteus]MCV7516258.1 ROK family protein [Micrococcus luteus]